MANEITLSFNLQLTNGNYTESVNPGSVRIDQAAIGANGGVYSVPTSEEVVDTGDVSTEGLLYLQNLDATNYINYGPESGGAMVSIAKLEPGEFAFLRLDSTATLRWQANTAAVKVKMLLLED